MEWEHPKRASRIAWMPMHKGCGFSRQLECLLRFESHRYESNWGNAHDPAASFRILNRMAYRSISRWQALGRRRS